MKLCCTDNTQQKVMCKERRSFAKNSNLAYVNIPSHLPAISILAERSEGKIRKDFDQNEKTWVRFEYSLRGAYNLQLLVVGFWWGFKIYLEIVNWMTQDLIVRRLKQSNSIVVFISFFFVGINIRYTSSSLKDQKPELGGPLVSVCFNLTQGFSLVALVSF